MRSLTKRAFVSTAFRELDVHGLPTFADGTVLGLTDQKARCPTPTVPLATVTQQATTLRGTSAKRSAGNRSLALTQQEADEASDLINSLTTNAHYVKDTANALYPGDAAAAGQLIVLTGYSVRGQATPAQRTFEVADDGPNWVHLRVHKARPGNEGHLWRYGITTAKGIAPTTLVTRFTLSADLIVTDLPTSAVVGVQHASILPTPRPGAGGAAPAAGAAKAAVSAKRHPMVSHAVADPYEWTGFLYTTVG